MEKDRIILDILVNLKNEENITLKELEDIIESPFKFAREITKSMDFKEMSLEEFRNAKKNFNIPGFGKLYAKEEIFYNLNKKK
jgi:hypothetical protein